MSTAYHHGDLRRAVLDRAAEVIAVEGPGGFSLRSLANDLGVSHTAPRHHFGSREGVLTALAAEGYALLAERMREVVRTGGGFADVGVAYVAFAVEFPAHFVVMFTPDLLDLDEPVLAAAREATYDQLRNGVAQLESDGQVDDGPAAILAAWALMHGIANLALSGSLDASALRSFVADGDLLEIARRSATMLFSRSDEAGS